MFFSSLFLIRAKLVWHGSPPLQLTLINCALKIIHYHALLYFLKVIMTNIGLFFFFLQLKWKCKKDDELNGGYSQDILLKLLHKVGVLKFHLCWSAIKAIIYWNPFFHALRASRANFEQTCMQKSTLIWGLHDISALDCLHFPLNKAY